MNELDYQKLNNYLNLICKKLEEKDSFLLTNLFSFVYFSQRFYYICLDYDLKEEDIEEVIPYNKLFDITKEILKTIDSSYPTIFDELIQKGIIEVNEELKSSNFHKRNDVITIDVKQTNSYYDVSVLIHEFMHYTNSNGLITKNRDILSETISIYFQKYAQDYMIKNYGFSYSQVKKNIRLGNLFTICNAFNWYSMPLLAYYNFGELDYKSYLDIDKYFVNESKIEFEMECKKVLSNLEMIEEQYRKINPDKELDEYIIDQTKLDKMYRYQFGEALSYYLLEYKDMETVKSINKKLNSDLGYNINELLECYGINISDDLFMDKCINIIEEDLKENAKRK